MRFWMVLVALIIVSCSKKVPEPEPATETTPTASEAERAKEAPAAPMDEGEVNARQVARRGDLGEPGLELLTSGKPPLVRLRRTFEQGFKQKLEVEVGLGTAVGDAPPARPTPQLRYLLTLETKDVSPDGSKATVEAVFDRAVAAETAPASWVLKITERVTGSLAGARARYTLSSLGRSEPVRFDVPEDSRSDLARLEVALGTVTLPFPEEEVGQGAKWTFVRAIEERSGTADQRMTYEITKIEASRVQVRLTYEQTVPERSGSGGSVELGATGTGEATWDLTKLAPVTATQVRKQQGFSLRDGKAQEMWTLDVVQLSGH